MSKRSLEGYFFFSYDGKKLYKIADAINSHYMIVEEFEGLIFQSKSVWPVPKITGFKLFPTIEEAMASKAVKP